MAAPPDDTPDLTFHRTVVKSAIYKKWTTAYQQQQHAYRECDSDAVHSYLMKNPNTSFCDPPSVEFTRIRGAVNYAETTCRSRQLNRQLMEEFPDLQTAAFTNADWQLLKKIADEQE